MSVVLQGVSLHLAFQDCFAIFPNTNMTWMRNTSLPFPWKEHLWWRSVARLSFHPCEEQEKTFITTLLGVDKVSLFIQSGRDKPWMKLCGAARESWWKEGTDKKQLGFQFPLCVHVSRWHLSEKHPRLVRRLETEPLLSPPSDHLYYRQPSPFLPPRAPPPELIHSHYETIV